MRHEAEILLADTPEEFAKAVVRMLSDEQLAEELARRSAALVRERFGWDQVAVRFAELCEEACVTDVSVADRPSHEIE